MEKYQGFINKLNQIQAKKLAVVGSRTFDQEERVKKELKYVVDNTLIDTIVSGGAKGVDTFAEIWADENGLKKIIYPAQWDKFGRSAGYRRNVDIVENADAILVFWKEGSAGTKHTIEIAKKEDKPLFVNHLVIN